MRRLCLTLLLALCPLPVLAAALLGVTVEQGAGGVERLRFTTDSATTPTRIFTLAGPNRVVIDLPPMTANLIALPPSYQGKLLRGIRFGRFDAATARVVIDVAVPVTVVGNLTVPAQNGTQPQLVVDLVAKAGAVTSPTAPTAPFPAPASPVIAQETKPLIIIDAGHGGQDPGAIGIHGTREKNVTLDFAKALRDGLLRTGRYRVALTRETDTFIMLPERVNIARKRKGDVFISLHADSNPRADARGLSVYTLSETASDDEAAALADRENKSDIIEGLDLNTADEDVASILIDLAQRETMNRASVLAEKVVEHLHPRVTQLPNTHRFAGFRVLKAPDIPSILVEVGFLSNPQDEKQLQSREYQSLVVSSLIAALDAYQKE